MSDKEIRLECFREVMKHQGINVEAAIEAAKKAAEFVISGDRQSPHEDSQRTD